MKEFGTFFTKLDAFCLATIIFLHLCIPLFSFPAAWWLRLECNIDADVNLFNFRDSVCVSVGV